MRLYDVTDAPWVRRQIDGLVSISARKVARRLGDDAWRGYVRGTEITLTLDEAYFGAEGYLLGAVLSRFFGLYAGANTFTELVITRRQREEVVARWPARSGDLIVA